MTEARTVRTRLVGGPYDGWTIDTRTDVNEYDVGSGISNNPHATCYRYREDASDVVIGGRIFRYVEERRRK